PFDVLVPVPSFDAQTLAGIVDAIFDERIRNLALSKVEAIDLSSSYSRKTDWGDVRFGANMAYLIDSHEQALRSAPVVDNFNVVLRPARFKGQVSAGLSRGGWDAQLNLNYIGSYHNPYPEQEQNVPSWTTLDLSLAYEFGRDSGPQALQGTSLGFVAQNLF